MKRTILLFLFALISLLSFAQAPDSFNYQAVVRDAAGVAMVSQPVGVQISILQGVLPGMPVFVETYAISTNALGIITVSIGSGTIQNGDIQNIDWSNGPYHMNVAIDITGGSTYTDMGTVQLLSVPFALFAKTAGNAFSGDYSDLSNKPVLDGDVTGQIDANSVTAIQGKEVSTNLPADGQVLKWNAISQNWEPSDDQLGAAGTTDGVVTGASFSGTGNKTLTLIRSNGLGDISAVFTDLVDDADANPTNEIQSLSLAGSNLTISGSNTVTLPVNTYTAGSGIAINGSSQISNTQPDQTVTLTGSGSTSISGSYPNFTISSSDSNSGGTVTSIATGNGITGGTITATGTLGLAGQALAFHNLSTNGLITRTGTGSILTRSIIAGNGMTIANGDGISGNPTISANFGTTSTTIAAGDHAHANYNVAGTNGMVQFNNDGSFGATSSLFWDNPNVRLGVGTNTPTAMMEVKQTTTMPTNGPLFEVKNRLGQTVFIVYEDSVRIYVGDDVSKTSKGAFAVSGRNSAKQVTHDFFKVTPDSVRVYLDSASTMGGFAVKSFGQGKRNDYMSVFVDTAEVLDPSVSRVQWYPSKEAFLAGRVLIEDPDSVGVNSWATGFESRSLGNYSQALGYRARAKGHSSTAIGRHANAVSPNSFALGDSAIAVGVGSYAIGSVGRDTTGQSTGIPTRAFGNYSFSIGLGTRTDSTNAFAFGNNTWARGVSSTAFGYESVATGRYSIAGGFRCGATGRSGVALGEEAIAGKFAVALGTQQYATAENAIAIGQFNFAQSNGAVAIGYQNDLQGSTYAIGDNNYSESGYYGSFTIGSSGIIRNSHAFIFGNYNEVTGQEAFAVGNHLLSSGYGSMAIGNSNTASGLFSTSIGFGITTSGQHSIGIALSDQTGTTILQNNTMAIMGGFVGIDKINPAYNLDVTGNIRATSAIYANANGAMYLKGGDDAEIWDVNQANTLAIYGTQNPAVATLRLGNGISEISGSGGNIGIGTNAPNVKLDVNGGIALRQTTPAQITAGPIANYNPGTGSSFRLSSNAIYSITGIAGGTDGRIIIITNVGTNAINFNHEGLSSNAGNRMSHSTGAQIALAPGGTITYIYDAVSLRWRDIALR